VQCKRFLEVGELLWSGAKIRESGFSSGQPSFQFIHIRLLLVLLLLCVCIGFTVSGQQRKTCANNL